MRTAVTLKGEMRSRKDGGTEVGAHGSVSAVTTLMLSSGVTIYESRINELWSGTHPAGLGCLLK